MILKNLHIGKPILAAARHQETRALMAAALVKMQLKENSISSLKDT